MWSYFPDVLRCFFAIFYWCLFFFFVSVDMLGNLTRVLKPALSSSASFPLSLTLTPLSLLFHPYSLWVWPVHERFVLLIICFMFRFVAHVSPALLFPTAAPTTFSVFCSVASVERGTEDAAHGRNFKLSFARRVQWYITCKESFVWDTVSFECAKPAGTLQT